ncbi:MAG: hypothetical protein J6Y84_07675 [Bacteroidaceae bacterium]|nr:hypothetical protein [Bacteroidaceae bacterium]
MRKDKKRCYEDKESGDFFLAYLQKVFMSRRVRMQNTSFPVKEGKLFLENKYRRMKKASRRMKKGKKFFLST